MWSSAYFATSIFSYLKLLRSIRFYNHTIHLSDELVQKLMVNWRRYGIVDEEGRPDFPTRSEVVTIACNAADMCMKRALNDPNFASAISDKRFWRGSTQEIAQHLTDSSRKGFLGGLFWGW